jgi:hypothetical protein
MAAILQLRRGNTDITLTEGELYLNNGAGTIQFGSGSTTLPYKLLPLDTPAVGNINLIGNATISGILTATEYHSSIVSSSVIYQSGSSKFGDTGDDIMQVTGSLSVSGSNNLIGIKTITGSVLISGSKTIIGLNVITGSLLVSGSQNFIGIKTLTGSIFITGSKTIIGNVIITGSTFYAANTSAVAPLNFNTGSAVLKTNTITGDLEVDANGMMYYSYDGGSRGIVTAEQSIYSTGSYTLSISAGATAYPLFSGVVGSGQVYVRGNTTYEFETLFSVSGISTGATTCAVQFAIVPLTATISSFGYTGFGTKAVSADTVGTQQMSHTSGSGTPNLISITTGTTNTFAQCMVKGFIRTSSNGFIQPGIGLSQGTPVTVNIAANSYFKIKPMGANDTQYIGKWS